MEWGGLPGYGWLTVFRQVQLSFSCLENLGKINKSLKLSWWTQPFGNGRSSRDSDAGLCQGKGGASCASRAGTGFPVTDDLGEASAQLCLHVTSSLPLGARASCSLGKTVDRRRLLHWSPHRLVVRRPCPKAMDNSGTNTPGPRCSVPRASTTPCSAPQVLSSQDAFLPPV